MSNKSKITDTWSKNSMKIINQLLKNADSVYFKQINMAEHEHIFGNLSVRKGSDEYDIADIFIELKEAIRYTING